MHPLRPLLKLTNRLVANQGIPLLNNLTQTSAGSQKGQLEAAAIDIHTSVHTPKRLSDPAAQAPTMHDPDRNAGSGFNSIHAQADLLRKAATEVDKSQIGQSVIRRIKEHQNIRMGSQHPARGATFSPSQSSHMNTSASPIANKRKRSSTSEPVTEKNKRQLLNPLVASHGSTSGNAEILNRQLADSSYSKGSGRSTQSESPNDPNINKGSLLQSRTQEGAINHASLKSDTIGDIAVEENVGLDDEVHPESEMTQEFEIVGFGKASAQNRYHERCIAKQDQELACLVEKLRAQEVVTARQAGELKAWRAREGEHQIMLNYSNNEIASLKVRRTEYVAKLIERDRIIQSLKEESSHSKARVQKALKDLFGQVHDLEEFSREKGLESSEALANARKEHKALQTEKASVRRQLERCQENQAEASKSRTSELTDLRSTLERTKTERKENGEQAAADLREARQTIESLRQNLIAIQDESAREQAEREISLDSYRTELEKTCQQLKELIIAHSKAMESSQVDLQDARREAVRLKASEESLQMRIIEQRQTLDLSLTESSALHQRLGNEEASHVRAIAIALENLEAARKESGGLRKELEVIKNESKIKIATQEDALQAQSTEISSLIQNLVSEAASNEATKQTSAQELEKIRKKLEDIREEYRASKEGLNITIASRNRTLNLSQAENRELSLESKTHEAETSKILKVSTEKLESRIKELDEVLIELSNTQNDLKLAHEELKAKNEYITLVKEWQGLCDEIIERHFTPKNAVKGSTKDLIDNLDKLSATQQELKRSKGGSTEAYTQEAVTRIELKIGLTLQEVFTPWTGDGTAISYTTLLAIEKSLGYLANCSSEEMRQILDSAVNGNGEDRRGTPCKPLPKHFRTLCDKLQSRISPQN